MADVPDPDPSPPPLARGDPDADVNDVAEARRWP